MFSTLGAANQMFTVIDDLLQVRAWQVDLHGALMDGRQNQSQNLQNASEYILQKHTGRKICI